MEKNESFTRYTKDLLSNQNKQPINPRTIELAKEWYNNFAGKHAVSIDDKELVDMYMELNCINH